MTTPPPAVDADTLLVARVLTATDAEGPGTRTAIWVQGCRIRCPGCFNPHLWGAAGGRRVELSGWLPPVLDDAAAGGVEGITLLGGEPFEQAAPLARLATAARERGLSVMTFSGYTYAELRRWAADRTDIAALLSHTDLLADGPFRADLLDHTRPWVGSSNQGLRALTPRYAGIDVTRRPDRVEIRIDRSGTVAVNGWADTDRLDLLLDDLRGRGHRAGRKP
ncbi:4Fe-4S single cluster domain-containing protein [Skermania piniformis]|uniref:4Fe-4S single cluster domain-containing protein n=1 Tax=Skermania pinensis TaxID=39122 RepID=UPI00082AC0B0|nr:4Fe-4S single cluster domain-containing protein [Skermania piniformis]